MEGADIGLGRPEPVVDRHGGQERTEAAERRLVDRLAGEDDVAEPALLELGPAERLALRFAKDQARHAIDHRRARLRHRPAEGDGRVHRALVDRHEAGAGAGGGEQVEDREVEGHRGDLRDHVVGGERELVRRPCGKGGGAPLALDDALRRAGRARGVEDVGLRRRVERVDVRRRGARRVVQAVSRRTVDGAAGVLAERGDDDPVPAICRSSPSPSSRPRFRPVVTSTFASASAMMFRPRSTGVV